MRALRKEPEWRYQSAEQLRDDIARYLEGRPVSDLPDVPPTPLAARRNHIQTENSLAVLPLKLLDTGAGSDSGPDYLGTGLADVLITRLSACSPFCSATYQQRPALRRGNRSVAGRSRVGRRFRA